MMCGGRGASRVSGITSDATTGKGTGLAPPRLASGSPPEPDVAPGGRANTPALSRDHGFGGLQPLVEPVAAELASGSRRRGSWRPSWRSWYFLAVVVVPVLLASLYFGVLASDQYTTQFRFTLRTGSSAAMPILAPGSGPMPASIPGAGATIVWDSYAIVQFIESRDMIDQLAGRLDLRRLYAPPGADFLARLDPRAPAERVVEFWRRMVDPFFDMTTGVVSVQVRAFRPSDSLSIAAGVLAVAEAHVNELSQRARDDALRGARSELDQAARNLEDAELAVQSFRDRNGVLDPAHVAGLDETLEARQKEELATLQAQYLSLRDSLAPASPTLAVLTARIDALRSVLDREQAADTGSAPARSGTTGDATPQALAAYRDLEIKQELREKAYASAEQSLEVATADANRQQLYLDEVVSPNLPEMSDYPQRLRSILIVLGLGLVAWALGCLAVSAVQDHL